MNISEFFGDRKTKAALTIVAIFVTAAGLSELVRSESETIENEMRSAMELKNPNERIARISITSDRSTYIDKVDERLLIPESFTASDCRDLAEKIIANREEKSAPVDASVKCYDETGGQRLSIFSGTSDQHNSAYNIRSMVEYDADGSIVGTYMRPDFQP